MAVLPTALAAARADARAAAPAGELLGELDRLAAPLDDRLAALAHALPAAATFAESARADLVRHRRERAALAAARGLAVDAPVHPAAVVDRPRSLPVLKAAIEELMHAHAEGLPRALGDAELVQRLADQMVDLSRLATVVDLWIEKEGGGE
jgi:hypothetical protein